MTRRQIIAALLSTVRHDRSAAALVAANLFLFAQAWWSGAPIGTVLVVYWIELLIIYVVPVNLFGIIVGGTLDNEFMGTEFQAKGALSPSH